MLHAGSPLFPPAVGSSTPTLACLSTWARAYCHINQKGNQGPVCHFPECNVPWLKGLLSGDLNVTINIYKGSSVAVPEGSLLLEKAQTELKRSGKYTPAPCVCVPTWCPVCGCDPCSFSSPSFSFFLFDLST